MEIGFLLDQKETGVIDINGDASMTDCINLLNEKRVGVLLVVDEDNSIRGIISERDILRLALPLEGRWSAITVGEVMTPAQQLITAKRKDSVQKAMSLMTKYKIRHLPVVEKGKAIGIISIGDVVKTLLDLTIKENKEIKEYLFVSGRY